MPGGEAAVLEVLWSGMLPARDSSPKHVVCSLISLTVVEMKRWMNEASEEEGNSGSAEEHQIGGCQQSSGGIRSGFSIQSGRCLVAGMCPLGRVRFWACSLIVFAKFLLTSVHMGAI